MKDKTYRRLMAAVIVLGLLVTIGLCAYTFYIYPDSSIIAFISNEMW